MVRACPELALNEVKGVVKGVVKDPSSGTIVMRIACLSPAITEILFALEKQDLIICTDQFSNYPEAAKDIPHLQDHQNVNVEDVLEHEPEMVFTSTVIQEKLAAELKARDVSVVHQDPRTINEIYESIRSIGMMLDCDKEAGELILSMQQGFNDVKKKAGLLPQRLKVYIEEWHQPPMVSGNWVPEVIRVAGGESFPIPPGELSREVSLNEVQTFDPDLVVLSWCGAGLHAEQSIYDERGWDLPGDVKVIDDSLLNRPGPRLVEGAQRLYGWLFEMLH